MQKIILKNKNILRDVSSFILIGYMKSENSKNMNLNSILDHIKVNFFSNLIVIDAIKKDMLKMNLEEFCYQVLLELSLEEVKIHLRIQFQNF